MSPSVSRLLVVLALALGLSVAAAECVPGYTKDAQGATVRYAIKQGADCSEQIVAIVGGREQVVLNGDPYSFIWVELVNDFDGDGLEDALIGSQMGNCCPPSHVVVS
ncbi:MAG: hypothetical protein H3C69_09835, partial [Candidatus Promineofilum sp.]|nr:hypothetical protein [Promineifilum sp.]